MHLTAKLSIFQFQSNAGTQAYNTDRSRFIAKTEHNLLFGTEINSIQTINLRT